MTNCLEMLDVFAYYFSAGTWTGLVPNVVNNVPAGTTQFKYVYKVKCPGGCGDCNCEACLRSLLYLQTTPGWSFPPQQTHMVIGCLGQTFDREVLVNLASPPGVGARLNLDLFYCKGNCDNACFWPGQGVHKTFIIVYP